MKDWMTSLIGLALFLLWFVDQNPQDFSAVPVLIHFARFTLGPGALVLGLVGADGKLASLIGIIRPALEVKKN